MIKDPIVEEIRAIRDEQARRFNYDIDAIIDDIQKREQDSERPVVTLEPKAPVPRPKSA